MSKQVKYRPHSSDGVSRVCTSPRASPQPATPLHSIGPSFFARSTLAAADQLRERFEVRGATNKELALNAHTVGDLEEPSQYSTAAEEPTADPTVTAGEPASVALPVQRSAQGAAGGSSSTSSSTTPPQVRSRWQRRALVHKRAPLVRAL